MVTDCPKCNVRLQDLGTAVPWCDRCAWTPPETENVFVPLPDLEVEDRVYEEAIEIALEPERFAGDADAAYYRRVRYPEQDPEPIRHSIWAAKKPPRWLRTSYRYGRPVR